jgi:hypothetical protein
MVRALYQSGHGPLAFRRPVSAGLPEVSGIRVFFVFSLQAQCEPITIRRPSTRLVSRTTTGPLSSLWRLCTEENGGCFFDSATGSANAINRPPTKAAHRLNPRPRVPSQKVINAIQML